MSRYEEARRVFSEPFRANLRMSDVATIQRRLGMKVRDLGDDRHTTLGHLTIAESAQGATTLRLKRQMDDPTALRFEVTTFGASEPSPSEISVLRDQVRHVIAEISSKPDWIGIPSKRTYPRAKIIVCGIGGRGVNVIQRMIHSGVRGVKFAAFGTDSQSLAESEADFRLNFQMPTKSRHAVPDPERGRAWLDLQRDKIERTLNGCDIVFIAAGEGGSTATIVAPIVAEVARSVGALTIGIVTRPFGFEGRKRATRAEHGIDALRELVDALIVINNDALLDVSDPGLSFDDSLSLADDAVITGVTAITDLVTAPHLVAVDLAEVRSIMSKAGPSVIGVGRATGENRARQSAERAIASPMLTSSIQGAQAVLLSVSGPSTMSLHEATEAARVVTDHVDAEADIVFGAAIDDFLQEEMKVIVVAGGLGSQ